jgi:hypothetical protein
MAAALIAALPTIVVYLALGKLFMRGLLAGALKGWLLLFPRKDQLTRPL